jgi:hypothetical protein
MNRIAILLVCLLSSEAHAGWFSYDNYEDCMLDEMKGQVLSMHYEADKFCTRQFGIEVEVNASDLEWNFADSAKGSSIRLEKSPTQYEITKGTFLFSDKPCEGLKNEDFRPPEILNFSNGEALLPKISKTSCGRAVSFRGKYK